MDFISLSSFLPYVSLPLIAVVRQLIIGRTYGSLAFLNKQAQAGKVEYTTDKPTISVVIVAHNQAFQLEQNLPKLLEQEYPNFDVIVVNDCSADQTEEVLKEMSLRYKHLYHTFTLPSARYISHRKLAITLGVKASHSDWIVLTEADCTPASDQWLNLLSRNFTESTNLVLGYANYQHESGLFNHRVVYDRLLENIHFLSRVIYNDKAYRGDGCNMAFRKSVFQEHEGFLKNLKLMRGEDTLLVNDLAKPGQTRVECDPQSIVQQEAPARRKSWVTDKVFLLESRLHLNPTGRWALHYFSLQTFLTYFCYLLVIGYLAIGIAWSNYLLAAVAIVTTLLLIAGSIIPLYNSCKSIHERTYISSQFWYELTLPIQNAFLRIRHQLTRKDEFMRK